MTIEHTFDTIRVWERCCSRGPRSPPRAGRSLGGLVAEAAERLDLAGQAGVETVDDDALGAVVAELARVESRAVALRLALSAEADRRRVAEETAETGTDAWLARLTGSTREQAAGGLRLAGLLADRYAATREAFAAGALRVEQVRVIVNAAEQAPVEASTEQVAAAEQWLVDRATGASTPSGRPTDAKRLRQAARRMFAHLDRDLADRHQAILLGREARTAEAETFLALHDNGDGSFSGRFRIPELHGHLLTQTLDRLTAPRARGVEQRASGAGYASRSRLAGWRTASTGGRYVAGGRASPAQRRGVLRGAGGRRAYARSHAPARRHRPPDARRPAPAGEQDRSRNPVPAPSPALRRSP